MLAENPGQVVRLVSPAGFHAGDKLLRAVRKTSEVIRKLRQGLNRKAGQVLAQLAGLPRISRAVSLHDLQYRAALQASLSGMALSALGADNDIKDVFATSRKSTKAEIEKFGLTMDHVLHYQGGERSTVATFHNGGGRISLMKEKKDGPHFTLKNGSGEKGEGSSVLILSHSVIPSQKSSFERLWKQLDQLGITAFCPDRPALHAPAHLNHAGESLHTSGHANTESHRLLRAAAGTPEVTIPIHGNEALLRKHAEMITRGGGRSCLAHSNGQTVHFDANGDATVAAIAKPVFYGAVRSFKRPDKTRWMQLENVHPDVVAREALDLRDDITRERLKRDANPDNPSLWNRQLDAVVPFKSERYEIPKMHPYTRHRLHSTGWIPPKKPVKPAEQRPVAAPAIPHVA